MSNHDTLSLIAPPDGTHPGPPFSSYSEAYMADLESHDAQYKGFKERNSIPLQLAYLQSLDKVELVSQKRIEKGGLFVDFDLVTMEERAKKVQLKPGWKEMMHNNKIKSLEHHIISVGWSARFIMAALQETTKPTSICANEVEVDTVTGRGTGRLTKSSDAGESQGQFGIRIAQHKIREMNRIMASRQNVKTVFAGDSNTDLPCLLDSDVGLILGNSKSLRDTITRLGLDSHLSASVEEWKEKRKSASLLTSKPDLVIVVDWFKGAEVIETLLQEV